jgi:selenocysteine-specific elongation factor
MPVVMGTAGHIDHGKTSVIRALTGIDCDRLAEEKKRGITIELGFAHLDLPGAEQVGVVDVPGHERFVKNMVAGAAGIDFVLLVVAADEGIMPQTREHLDICRLLGIDQGLVALTKTDLADPELLELVTEETREYLEGTVLSGASMIPVSARTGEGLDRLRAALADTVANLAAHPRRSDLFRLPVDRVFTLKGHGTIVTGTLVSGEIAGGEDVTLYPGGLAAKVRSLQVHDAEASRAEAGQRTAVNLAGLDVGRISRGDTLARPGTLVPSDTWDVELEMLASAPAALRHRKEFHLHHGSREMLARVLFLDRDKLKAGERCLCQLKLPEPVAAVRGDRVVLRSFSPLRTIAGGRVVNPLGTKIKRWSRELDRLETLAGGDPAEVVATRLDMAGARGLDLTRLKLVSGLESRALEKLLQDLASRQEVFRFDAERQAYVSAGTVRDLAGTVVQALEAFHEEHPEREAMPRSRLASGALRRTDPKLLHFLLERLVRQGELEALGDGLRLPGHTATWAADSARLRDQVLARHVEAGLTPPNIKDLSQELGTDDKTLRQVLEMLREHGDLAKVGQDMYFHSAALEGLKDLVTGHLAEHGEMGAPQFKELTGLTRKYLIPLLEYLDKEKVTMRVGDVRRLRGQR